MLMLAMLVLVAPQAGAALPEAKPVCQRAQTSPAVDVGKPSIRPLGREPNATRVLAVLRTEGGCIKPVVVSDSVGSAARR